VDVLGICPPVTVFLTAFPPVAAGVPETGRVVPEGVVPDGADGVVPDGVVPDGAVPDGADGVVPDGVVPDGATTTVAEAIWVAVMPFALPVAVAVFVVVTSTSVLPV
jgi:hypothetical protein